MEGNKILFIEFDRLIIVANEFKRKDNSYFDPCLPLSFFLSCFFLLLELCLLFKENKRKKRKEKKMIYEF